MSILLRNALKVAMEEFDDNATINVDGEVTESVLEMTEAGAETDEAETVVEELEDAAASVESICIALEAHIADGGMNAQAARNHNVAMENVLRRLPLDASRYTVSHEAFGGAKDRLTASQEALEGAKELLGKVYAGMKNAVDKAVEAVKSFYVTISKSGKAISMAGRMLKQKAASARRTAPEGAETIEATRVAKALHKDGNFDGDIDGALGEILSFLDTVGQSAGAAGRVIAETASKVSAGKFDELPSKEQLAEIMIKPINQRPLPGGRLVRVDDGDLDLAQVESFKGKAEVQLPSVSDIEAIADKISKIGDKLVEFDAKYFKATYKEVDRILEAYRKAADKNKDKSYAGRAGSFGMKEQVKGMMEMVRAARGIGPDAVRYAANAAKAAYSFSKTVLKKYGVEVEVPAEMAGGEGA